jgi:2-keto-3-deoxy-L-rhamnonate aldolase RhmA
MTRANLWVWTIALGLTASPVVAQGRGGAAIPIFNTVKEKLARGEQVVGGTIDTPDPDIYCAVANAGFDFTWIEMQHSPLTYAEVAHMIWACRGAPAIPFIRVPTATEGDIQKATDIGALGIIIPMVDNMEEIRDAVRFAHYPPMGVRSQGGGQYGALYGGDYRRAANENIMIVAMIENPVGVEIADEIAGLEGVDAVFVASSDLGSFTGLRQGDPAYEALVTRIKDATAAAGRSVGGPLAWMSTREGYSFFQGPSATALIRTGGRATLEDVDPCRFLPPGTAPVPGEDPCEE